MAKANGVWRVEASSDSDPNSFTISPVLKTDPATTGLYAVSVIAREHGGVWAGSHHGLFEIDPDGRLLRRIIREHGLVTLQSWPLLIDRAGDLWLSSMSGSLQRLAAVGFSSFGAADGLDAPLVRSISRRRSGDLIVNGAPDVLQRFDGQRFIPTRPGAAPRGGSRVGLVSGRYRGPRRSMVDPDRQRAFEILAREAPGGAGACNAGGRLRHIWLFSRGGYFSGGPRTRAATSGWQPRRETRKRSTAGTERPVASPAIGRR